MSVKLSERTKRMRKNFMKERREGKNIAQIAKEYEMNVSTVYSSLQIIADENNVSRESLLEKCQVLILGQMIGRKEKIRGSGCKATV